MRIIDWKYRYDIITDQIRPVHSATPQARSSARKFPAGEINQVISERVINPAITEPTVLIVLASRKYGSLHLCIDYRKLKAVAACNLYYFSCMGE